MGNIKFTSSFHCSLPYFLVMPSNRLVVSFNSIPYHLWLNPYLFIDIYLYCFFQCSPRLVDWIYIYLWIFLLGYLLFVWLPYMLYHTTRGWSDIYLRFPLSRISPSLKLFCHCELQKCLSVNSWSCAFAFCVKVMAW